MDVGCLNCGRVGEDFNECPSCGNKDKLVTIKEAMDLLMLFSLHYKKEILRTLKEMKDDD